MGQILRRSSDQKFPMLRYRTFVRHRIVDVKTRLIALWHQSLQREKSRAWTLFLN
jgi:hypothetical protein